MVWIIYFAVVLSVMFYSGFRLYWLNKAGKVYTQALIILAQPYSSNADLAINISASDKLVRDMESTNWFKRYCAKSVGADKRPL